MKNFQQNLLIVLALSLCGLCVYQWYFQGVQRVKIEDLNKVIFDQAAAIQNYTNSMATMDRQVAQMDQRIAEFKKTAMTNDLLIVGQKHDILRLQFINDSLTNEVATYKQAVDSLKSKLSEAYDGIKKQNESLKELVAQRDEFVQKFNDSVKARNEIVTKYNDLVEQMNKLQAADEKKKE